MGLIEKLRQYDADKVLREEQLKVQQADRQAAIAAIEMKKTQREVAERERRAKRKAQAEKFRGESGISDKVEELVKFLEEPRTVACRYDFKDTSEDGHPQDNVGYFNTGRGRRVYESEFRYKSPRDPDSVYDTVCWDRVKYIAVETCPDGTIVFHGNLFGSTTIKDTNWRSKEKDQLFDKALEKAYKNPGKGYFSPRGYSNEFYC